MTQEIICGSILCALVCAMPDAGQAQKAPAKKLIEYGWDTPTPDFVRRNIREMEKLPFDGVIFYLPDGRDIFKKTKWNVADPKYAKALDDCRNIEWQEFSDNFLCVLAARDKDWDWFSDADWKAALHNLGIVSKAAALARCKGLCFDAEPYGDNPWKYPELLQAKEKSFGDYQTKVRRRGEEFIATIQKHLPNPVIHTFFQLSLFGGIMEEPNADKRAQLLSQHHYGLLPAFLNGMLDGAKPGTIITDGNEPAYYYTNALQYYRSYHMIRQKALSIVAPENTGRYRTQMQVSQALYVDYVFGLGVWGERPVPARALSPEDRAKWFEHNIYYALQTSDEYVWLYSEKMNWWKNADLPPGLAEAVESARRKQTKRQPLGFDQPTVR